MVKDGASQTRRPVLALTITLAIIFLILGEAAYESAQLLQHALHPQTSADVAALVCTSLKTQNYAQLSSKLEPAATPTATNKNNKEPTLSDQLRGLDGSNGKVTSCTYHVISESDTSAQYALTLKRAKMPVPMGLLLVLRFHSGNWMISHDTDFTGQPR